MRIHTGACDEFRTADELAGAIISLARKHRAAPPIDRVHDVQSRLESMGVVQLRNLLALAEQGKSTIIFPQIVRDLGYQLEVVERHAA